MAFIVLGNVPANAANLGTIPGSYILLLLLLLLALIRSRKIYINRPSITYFSGLFILLSLLSVANGYPVSSLFAAKVMICFVAFVTGYQLEISKKNTYFLFLWLTLVIFAKEIMNYSHNSPSIYYNTNEAALLLVFCVSRMMPKLSYIFPFLVVASRSAIISFFALYILRQRVFLLIPLFF